MEENTLNLLERPEYNFLRTDLHLQFRFLRFAQRPGTAAGLRQGTYIPPEDARSGLDRGVPDGGQREGGAG